MGVGGGGTHPSLPHVEPGEPTAPPCRTWHRCCTGHVVAAVLVSGVFPDPTLRGWLSFSLGVSDGKGIRGVNTQVAGGPTRQSEEGSEGSSVGCVVLGGGGGQRKGLENSKSMWGARALGLGTGGEEVWIYGGDRGCASSGCGTGAHGNPGDHGSPCPLLVPQGLCSGSVCREVGHLKPGWPVCTVHQTQ